MLENYLESIVSIDEYLGRIVHIESLEDNEYVVVLDLLDGECITIAPCYESEIIVQGYN
jgi:hypothetical protein